MNKEKTFISYTTKMRATIVAIGLAFYSVLTYLYLIKMINRDAWSGLGLLDFLIVALIIVLIKRRKKQKPS